MGRAWWIRERRARMANRCQIQIQHRVIGGLEALGRGICRVKLDRVALLARTARRELEPRVLEPYRRLVSLERRERTAPLEHRAKGVEAAEAPRARLDARGQVVAVEERVAVEALAV